MEAMDLEKSLKLIRDSQLDIELLKRDNEKKCMENNLKIEELEAIIGTAEEGLEIGLKESGEDKLECKLGSVSFKKMPDEWKYQDEILMAWIISLPARLKNLYLKVTTTIKKGELKKQIIDNNEILFENSKLVDEDISHIELFLVNEEKSYKVEGIEIERQESKFSYSIKNLKK